MFAKSVTRMAARVGGGGGGVMPAVTCQRDFSGNGAPAKRVLVSGAAGQIAYSIVYRIAR